ncbi:MULTISPECIES: alpha/beta fold hydrolase [unclassified Agarivorans]|uniref:alpha/beta fold hydrolase n=1 Tax=unclassified Agarivorans TaxID=2636026 RepID=UPI003D7E7283
MKLNLLAIFSRCRLSVAINWPIFLLMSITLKGCGWMPKALQTQQQFIDNTVLVDPAIKHYQLKEDNFSLSVHSNGVAQQAVMLWIHGTPGSWEDSAYFISQSPLLSKVLVVSIDRPGWGQSQYLDVAKPISEFSQQVHYIRPLIKQLKQQHPELPLIVVGHSWGASLAPLLASSNAEVDGLLLLAGGLSAELTQPRWYNRFARSGVGHSLLGLFEFGQVLNHSNLDMYALATGLRHSDRLLANLKIPTIVVQGSKDDLVDPKNADFAESHLNPKYSKVLRLADQGHLLQIEQVALVSRCVLALAAQQLEQCHS